MLPMFQQLRMSDGKNPYCRDCMRLFNKKYKNSPKGSSIQKACVEKYKSKNKDKIKEYNRQYYLKNKQRILYNKKCRETTECLMIFDDPQQKHDIKKINKSREVYKIVIDPKPKRK